MSLALCFTGTWDKDLEPVPGFPVPVARQQFFYSVTWQLGTHNFFYFASIAAIALMNYRISRHAREEMERRKIPLETLESVLKEPQQVVDDPTGNKVYQSKVDFKEGKIYLVRVVTAEKGGMPVVVTVYRTSKVDKYWRKA
jgi:hypothetical protein